MLQSFVLQNSSLNIKSSKHENKTHFINVTGTSIRANEFKLENLYKYAFFQGLFSTFVKTLCWDWKWIWCLNLKNVFTIYSIRQMTFWLWKNCSKVRELENRHDLYTPALGPFNYHIEGKCKCIYQFLINLTQL